jgi:PAS domain S-box-containing protein
LSIEGAPRSTAAVRRANVRVLPEAAVPDPSLELLETMFMSAPIGFGVVDHELRYIRVNPALAAITGLPEHAHLGHTPVELMPNAGELQHCLRAVLDTGEAQINREVQPRDPAGRTHYWLASFYPVRGIDSVAAAGMVITDITERRRAERSNAVRHAVERALAESRSLEDTAPRILAGTCAALGWEVGVMWGVDQTDGVLRCAAVWCSPNVARSVKPFCDDTKTRTFMRGVGLPGRVWAANEPDWVPDVDLDENFPRLDAARRASLRTGFALPIVTAGETIGVLEFFTRAAQPRDEELLWALRSAGALIGQFAGRQWAEAEVAFQKVLLESQAEATLDGILIIDRAGVVLSNNRRLLEIWGIDRATLDALTGTELIEVLARRTIAPVRLLADLGEPAAPRQERSGTATLTDGRVIEWRNAPLATPAADGGGRALYFRDVTEQKRVHEELLAGQRRFSFLAQAGTLLSSSLHSSAVLERLARLAVPGLADWCAIDEVREDGSVRRLNVTVDDAGLTATARKLKRFGPHQGDPVHEVIRTGAPALIAHVTDAALVSASRNPSHLQLLRKLGTTSMLVVPLLVRGAVYGVVTLAAGSSGRVYGETDVELANELARRASLGVENATLYRERSHIARVLQQSLLPPALPHIEGVELADRYEAAGELNEVGGDFYDVFATTKNDWAIVMGDVCGKGPDAAAVTTLARYTIRAAAMSARRPTRVLGVLNEALLRQTSDSSFCRFATVAYARLRVMRDGTLRLTVASGGHPLPLLIRPDARVIGLSKTGIAVGVTEHINVVDHTFELQRGDAVVFYTDGVLEARGAAGIFGSERLEATLQACAGLSAEEIADRLHQTVMGFQQGTPRDDIAIVVLKIPG